MSSSAPGKKANLTRRRRAGPPARDAFWQRSSRPLRLIQLNAEVLDQGLVQVVDVVEVLPGILGGLAHELFFHQVKNDLAEVRGAIDSPHPKNDSGHQAKLAEGKLANPLDQLTAGNMVFGVRLAGFLCARLAPEQPLSVR